MSDPRLRCGWKTASGEEGPVRVLRVEALLARRVVGWAVFESAGAGLDPYDAAGDAIYVRPEYRRQGLGKAMCAAAEKLTGKKVHFPRSPAPESFEFWRSVT